jgi:hypothetical protein
MIGLKILLWNNQTQNTLPIGGYNSLSIALGWIFKMCFKNFTKLIY